MNLKHFYLPLFFVLLSIQVFSQSNNTQVPYTTPSNNRQLDGNHQLWLNLQLNGAIKGKWRWGCDFEMRRQADPSIPYYAKDKVGNDKWDIVKHPYQDAIRPYLHYHLNENIRFTVGGAYFMTWSFPEEGPGVKSLNSFTTTYYPEWRFFPQITLYNRYGRVQIQQRYRDEFRFLGTKTTDSNPADPLGPSSSYSFLQTGRSNRFRYMVRTIIPLNNKELIKGTWYVMASEEIFLSFGKDVQTNRMIDQSRTFVNIGYKFHEDIRVEFGYMNQTAFRMNNNGSSKTGLPGGSAVANNIDFNNNLNISLIFDNFNNLFKKKDKATAKKSISPAFSNNI